MGKELQNYDGTTPLANERHEAFVLLVMSGLPWFRAWQDAALEVGAEPAKRRPATNAGLSTMRRSDVRARVQYLREQAGLDDRSRIIARNEMLSHLSDMFRDPDTPPRERLNAAAIIARAQGYDEPERDIASDTSPGSTAFAQLAATAGAVRDASPAETGEVIDGDAADIVRT